jgi:hypothetical protein
MIAIRTNNDSVAARLVGYAIACITAISLAAVIALNHAALR